MPPHELRSVVALAGSVAASAYFCVSAAWQGCTEPELELEASLSPQPQPQPQQLQQQSPPLQQQKAEEAQQKPPTISQQSQRVFLGRGAQVWVLQGWRRTSTGKGRQKWMRVAAAAKKASDGPALQEMAAQQLLPCASDEGADHLDVLSILGTVKTIRHLIEGAYEACPVAPMHTTYQGGAVADHQLVELQTVRLSKLAREPIHRAVCFCPA